MMEGMMNRFVSAVALLTLAAACKPGSERNTADTGVTATPAAAPAPSGTSQRDTARGSVAQPMSPTSAAAPATARDSATRTRDTTGRTPAASAKNQTQSGVTNAKTGTSTLGPGIKKAEPTQGHAATSEGD